MKPLIIFLFLVLLGQAATALDSPASIHRLALVIGANDGGPHREKLRYAVADAKSILRILEEIGGVDPDSSRLLVEPDPETLLWELGRLRERIGRARSTGHKTEAIIYYSGHADASSLLLGKRKLPYSALQGEIFNLQADLCITILDSCASGAFIRDKGSRRVPSFLSDSSNDMKGFAVLTSSSADESSQESDLIRGSFFTHHLLSGLHGAADTTRDGKITLTEAYSFAFRETLAATTATFNGPQHPRYDIRMSGTGDIVLTDYLKSSVVLGFTAEMEGIFFLHDHQGKLIAELRKTRGVPLEYGLKNGKYRIIRIRGEEAHEARLDTPAAGTIELDERVFTTLKKTDTMIRGDIRVTQAGLFSSPARLQLFAGLSGRIAQIHDKWTVMPGIELGLGNDQFSFGVLGVNSLLKKRSSQLSYWGVFARHRLFRSSAFTLATGLLIGLGFDERPTDPLRPDQWVSFPFLLIDPCLGFSLQLSAKLNLRSSLSLPVFFNNVPFHHPLAWTIGLQFSDGKTL